VDVPEHRRVGDDGVRFERAGVDVVGAGEGAGREGASNDVLGHLSFFGDVAQIGRTGLSQYRPAGLDHPLRQFAGISGEGVEVVVAREDEAAMLGVRGDADAMAEANEAIGQAEEGIDVAVGADDHYTYV